MYLKAGKRRKVEGGGDADWKNSAIILCTLFSYPDVHLWQSEGVWKVIMTSAVSRGGLAYCNRRSFFCWGLLRASWRRGRLAEIISSDELVFAIVVGYQGAFGVWKLSEDLIPSCMSARVLRWARQLPIVCSRSTHGFPAHPPNGADQEQADLYHAGNGEKRL